VNFIKILHAAFTRANPKSIKIKLCCQYIFMLLGSACVKAGHLTLTPGSIGSKVVFLICHYL